MKKSKHFLYQINFNRSKYPEICEALEEAKKGDGIAWYLRQLISRDIEERRGNVHQPRPSRIISEREKPTFNKVEKESDLPDDNGGFV